MHAFFTGLIFSVFGIFNSNSLTKNLFFAFILSSFFSGFGTISTSITFDTKGFLKLSFLSITFLSSIILLYLIANSIVLFFNRSCYAIHLSSFILIFCSFLCPSLLEAIFGGFIAKKFQAFFNPVCEVSKIPKAQKSLPIYLKNIFLVFFIGLILSTPLMSELYFFLTSLTQNLHFPTFSYFALSFASFSILSFGYGMLIVFLRLQNENYSWHWISFLAPAASGIFLFIFSLFFYVQKVSPHSSESFELFCFWVGLISIVGGLSAGCCGYSGANIFVRILYSNLKID